MAATEAVKEALWLKRFINNIGLPGFKFDSVPIYIDNKSCIKLAYNLENYRRTKYIDARHYFIREAVESGDITIKWISGKENPADLFTKALGRPAFENYRNKLNMRSPILPLRGAGTK